MTEDEITLKQFLEQRIDSIETAINLQAIEYARRLDELNHEKESIRSIQRMYVLQESYDNRAKDIDLQLRTLNTFRDNIQGRIALYPAVAFMLSVGVEIALKFLFH